MGLSQGRAGVWEIVIVVLTGEGRIDRVPASRPPSG